MGSQMKEGRTITTEEWEALGVQTYGLTPDLIVPIAAADIEAIEAYVGAIQLCIPGRKRPTNAVVVEAHQPKRNPLVPLWHLYEDDQCYRRLHPLRQLWVHVDYGGYRRAWKRLGFSELSREVVLDHIRNRAAVRLSGYRHPFLRLRTPPDPPQRNDNQPPNSSFLQLFRPKYLQNECKS